MLNKKNYPITLLEEIASLLRHFYEVEHKYADTVTMTFGSQHLIEIKDKDNSAFRFIVQSPVQDNQRKSYCTVTKKPNSIHSLEEHSSGVLISDISKSFTNWISLIERYNQIDLSREDIFSRDEEKQFYDEFEIVEEEAELKALTIESQIKVYALLEELQERLKNKMPESEEVVSIVEDAEDLKKNLQNFPQSLVAKKVAKLKVRIKKIGIKFLLDVVDVTYKEAIKMALKGGVESISNIIT